MHQRHHHCSGPKPIPAIFLESAGRSVQVAFAHVAAHRLRPWESARATCGFRTVPKGDVCLHPFFTAIAIPEDSMTTKKPRKKPIKHLNINPPGSGITTRVFFGKKFVTIKVSIPSRRLDQIGRASCRERV